MIENYILEFIILLLSTVLAGLLIQKYIYERKKSKCINYLNDHIDDIKLIIQLADIVCSDDSNKTYIIKIKDVIDRINYNKCPVYNSNIDNMVNEYIKGNDD